ncbi:exosome complex component RRP46-like [Limulus polyphemus]|uniref:Exosome complex component RRP46-like n=1 Tax=Limulus polyphemus TaxID=6850 RepID=A0ABM1B9F0_LIMPO|nr:exosome complex component RRP46-like [Limulus polyphemus]
MLSDNKENETQSIRTLSAELSNLSRPDGSAIVAQGDTVVQSAVYGPVEVRPNKELPDKAYFDIVYKPLTGLPGCPEKLRERVIRNTLEATLLVNLHPRKSINLILQEMQNDGGLLACCINSACMALMDAGLAMKCLVAALNAVITTEGDVLLDPSLKQEEEAKACFTFAFESINHEVITSNTQGSYSETEFKKCLEICRSASMKVFDFYRECVQRRFSKEIDR